LSNSLKAKRLDKFKKLSFKETVQSRRIEVADTEDEDAIESGDDGDGEISDSAIEENDSLWAGSEYASVQAGLVDMSMFQRVESQANVTSPRSMLTMQLHNLQRATASGNGASHLPRTTPRNMLAAELTESLRIHLLCERKQKSTTVDPLFMLGGSSGDDKSSFEDQISNRLPLSDN
jgi:hypothetical protein